MDTQNQQIQDTQLDNTMDAHDQGVHQYPDRRGNWLWISAGLMIGLIVIQGGGMFESLFSGSQARAEMVSSTGTYTMMTTDGGNDEILVIVDSRQESMMIYRNINNTELRLLDREELSGLFARARARTMGRP